MMTTFFRKARPLAGFFWLALGCVWLAIVKVAWWDKYGVKTISAADLLRAFIFCSPGICFVVTGIVWFTRGAKGR
jgi:hypothetical protein